MRVRTRAGLEDDDGGEDEESVVDDDEDKEDDDEAAATMCVDAARSRRMRKARCDASAANRSVCVSISARHASRSAVSAAVAALPAPGAVTALSTMWEVEETTWAAGADARTGASAAATATATATASVSFCAF